MPNCTEERDLFGADGRRRAEVGFDGSEVTSHAGGCTPHTGRRLRNVGGADVQPGA